MELWVQPKQLGFESFGKKNLSSAQKLFFFMILTQKNLQ